MEKTKIPITALFVLKNILGAECKWLGNRRIAVNKPLKQETMKKKNLSTTNTLPFPSKKEYTSLGEVKKEFLGNFSYLTHKIGREIGKNMPLYKAYSDTDHSDIGPHYKTFPSIDLEDGYTTHVGMNWPERKDNLLLSLTKDFVLGNGGDNITFGMIYPDKPKKRVPAFLTESFFESFSGSTKFGKVYFFLIASKAGYISQQSSGEARWLFPEGVALGYRNSDFYVFNGFTDQIKYQGEKLMGNTIKRLDDILWSIK